MIAPIMEMFVTCRCLHCKRGIEFDASLFQTGQLIYCPHCHIQTQLFIPNEQPPALPPSMPESSQFSPSHDWHNDPMTDKQRAMFALYGIRSTGDTTKGKAANLIDAAKQSQPIPTAENQIIAAELFGKVRLDEVVDEIQEAIKIIANPKATIVSLKDAKRNVKSSVKNLTDIIDRRIEENKNANAEARATKTTQWLKERGYLQ